MATGSYPLPYVSADTWQTLLLRESSYQKFLRFFLAEFSFHHCGSCTGLVQNQASAGANTTEISWSGTVLVTISAKSCTPLPGGWGAQEDRKSCYTVWPAEPLIHADQMLHGPEPHLVFLSMVARLEGTWLISPGSHLTGKRASVFSSHGLLLECSHKSLT